MLITASSVSGISCIMIPTPSAPAAAEAWADQMAVSRRQDSNAVALTLATKPPAG